MARPDRLCLVRIMALGLTLLAGGPIVAQSPPSNDVDLRQYEGRYAEVRSVLVYHRGALRLEEYFYGYDRARPHPMRSLTKSVISLLAGIAVDRERCVRTNLSGNTSA